MKHQNLLLFLLIFAIVAATALLPPAEVSALCDIAAETGCANCSSGCGHCGTTCDGAETHIIGLDISNKGATSLPSSIGTLTHLLSLVLSTNALTALPDSVGDLVALTYLGADSNRLTVIPDTVCNLANMTILDIDTNRLSALPTCIDNCVAMTDLIASGNNLTAMPAAIADLAALTYLDISCNSLASLPAGIGSLTLVNTFDVHQNRLTGIPDAICGLTKVVSLDISTNLLSSLPWCLGAMTGLTDIRVYGNLLTALPVSMNNMSETLTSLYINVNQFTVLPAWLGNLTSLTSLGFGCNHITAIPSSFSRLTVLTLLVMDGNFLVCADLPAGIFRNTCASRTRCQYSRSTAVLCNSTFPAGASCVWATCPNLVPVCSPGPCNTSVCDSALGCVYRPVVCSNASNDACNVNTCNPTTGACVPVARNCSDGNPNTVDTCDAIRGCIHTGMPRRNTRAGAIVGSIFGGLAFLAIMGFVIVAILMYTNTVAGESIKRYMGIKKRN